jgi:hypothetical protein
MAWIPAMQTGDTFQTKGVAFINQMITFVNDMKKIPYEMRWMWDPFISYGDTYTNLDTHQTGDNIQDDFGMGNLHSRLNLYIGNGADFFRNDLAEGAHLADSLTGFYTGYIDRINSYLTADSLVDSSQYIDTAKWTDSQASSGMLPLWRAVPDTSYDSVENFGRIQGSVSWSKFRYPYLSKTVLNQTQALCKVIQDCVGYWMWDGDFSDYGVSGGYVIVRPLGTGGSRMIEMTPEYRLGEANNSSGLGWDTSVSCATLKSEAEADWDTNSWTSSGDQAEPPRVYEYIDNDTTAGLGNPLQRRWDFKNRRASYQFGIDCADTYQYPMPTSNYCKTFTFSQGGQDLIGIGEKYTVHTGSIDTYANTTGIITTPTYMDRASAGSDTNGASCSDTVASYFQYQSAVVCLWDTFADPDSGI